MARRWLASGARRNASRTARPASSCGEWPLACALDLTTALELGLLQQRTRAGWRTVRSDPTHRPSSCRGSAAFGVPKGGVPCFASKDFVKLVKDAGFWRDKGNQFNTKPPNRVDFVYTYAATNGPGGKKGNNP